MRRCQKASAIFLLVLEQHKLVVDRPIEIQLVQHSVSPRATVARSVDHTGNKGDGFASERLGDLAKCIQQRILNLVRTLL